MLARIGAFGGNNELYDEDELRINCNCQWCNFRQRDYIASWAWREFPADEGLTWFSPKCGLGVVVIEVADHLDHLSILIVGVQ